MSDPVGSDPDGSNPIFPGVPVPGLPPIGALLSTDNIPATRAGTTLRVNFDGGAGFHGLFNVRRFQVSNSGATYTPSAGVTSVLVLGVGGAGGGGWITPSATEWVYAQQGGQGAVVFKVLTAADATGQVMEIGTGGAGGTSGSPNGVAGGDTSFGALLVAKGGTAGLGNQSVASMTGFNASVTQTVPASGNVGDLILPAGYGGASAGASLSPNPLCLNVCNERNFMGVLVGASPVLLHNTATGNARPGSETGTQNGLGQGSGIAPPAGANAFNSAPVGADGVLLIYEYK